MDAGDAAAAAGSAALAAVLQLLDAATHASERGRLARAIELYERAVAAVEEEEEEETLRGSLVLPVLQCKLAGMYIKDAVARCTDSTPPATAAAAMRLDAHTLFCDSPGRPTLSLSQRCLALFHARWRAGSLLAPTPQEVAFFGGGAVQAQLNTIFFYISCANLAVAGDWPRNLRSRAEEAAHVHGVHGALRMALEADAQGIKLADASPNGDDVCAAVRIFFSLLHQTLNEDNMLRQLRATCGLTRDDEAALWQLVQRAGARTPAEQSQNLEEMNRISIGVLAAERERASADVARHGLRRCALPECQQAEPHPKAFKLCGRCRKVVYCSAAHQQEDWRRHKRDDGCKAATA
jgi:hypothetical protein